MAERPAYSAGKAAEQGQRCDRRARLLTEKATERREGCVVEAGAHADAEDELEAT